METQKELNQKILEITMHIREKYPELSKYLVEMTDTLPDEKHPDIDAEKLQAYYESLEKLVKEYAEKHEEA